MRRAVLQEHRVEPLARFEIEDSFTAGEARLVRDVFESVAAARDANDDIAGGPYQKCASADRATARLAGLSTPRACTNTAGDRRSHGPIASAERIGPTGAGPIDVEVADLNGDGQPDFVTADSHYRSVSVFVQDGGDRTKDRPARAWSARSRAGTALAGSENPLPRLLPES